MMTEPSINVRISDSMYHVVTTPCGQSWLGMTASDDLPIQVRRGLDHARTCEACREIDQPPVAPDQPVELRRKSCPECKASPETRHLDGCSAQYREEYVGGDA